MRTHNTRRRVILAAALFVTLAATPAVAQYQWNDIVRSAQPIEMESWGGVGYGDVAEGYVSYVIDLDYTGPLTLEVVVTDIRMGTAYEDDDSMLWLFDSDGYLVAENDDGPYGGYASLINGYEVEYPGRYYIVVTTHPNRPETDFNGQFAALMPEGASNISFDLVIEYGIREDFYSEDMWTGGPTEFWFTDFRSLSRPVRYFGDEHIEYGSVGSGIEVYRVVPDISGSVSVTARRSDGNYGDALVFVIDSEGYVLAEDDDSDGNGGSLIYDVYLEAGEEYYVVVTTYPNWPNTDDYGYVEGFPASGSDSFSYEMIVGPPQEYVYQDYYQSLPTEIFFDDFYSLASPIQYSGEDVYVTGDVADGVSLYRLVVSSPWTIGAEVYQRYGEYGDTMIFLIDEDGYVVWEDDDGGMEGGSLIPEASIEPGVEYYLAVTTYPNRPNYDEYGLVEGFALGGNGYVEYELVVSGPRDYYAYGYEGWGGETVYWFDDFPNMAEELVFTGGEFTLTNEVGGGIALYYVVPRNPGPASIQAVAASGYADLIMSVIAADGYVLAEDDDSAGNGGALIPNINLDDPDGYYVAVAQYPNWPNVDSDGYIEGYPDQGGEPIIFNLTLGPPREIGSYGGTAAEPYPDDGVPADSMDEIIQSAQHIDLRNLEGTGHGEVGIGYSAFAFNISRALYINMEVIVTEARQGTSYMDSDSMLALFDESGLWYATDDDGGPNNMSRLDSIWLDTPGTYYAIVTTFPNEPETRNGYFDYINADGESNIVFDLHVWGDYAAQ